MKYLKPFLWCFGIILLIELIVVSSPEWRPFRIITKPLVVGSLFIFFRMQDTDKKTKALVSAALLFSLIGDVQLIYAGEYESLFVGGLSAFLIAHVLYIIQFSRTRNKEIGILAPFLILASYAVSIFWYLSDSLGEMVLPVIFYISVILVMILFAYLRHDSMMDNSYICILAGALLFMLSDSILAITRFKGDIPYSRILVMGIYGIAQLLMVLGILKNATARATEAQSPSYSS